MHQKDQFSIRRINNFYCMPVQWVVVIIIQIKCGDQNFSPFFGRFSALNTRDLTTTVSATPSAWTARLGIYDAGLF
ncbi:hypothetical protein BD410DRAFT_786934 [Rickenella mellea]|uniref:Uncharacterized protein n=1 Tax=Rickenella mellea TaxID=50990 RepID=A0A4Y7Q8K8_9AGAM|nr:hypothetical protein BD410DRAFT_786934 [Rickenella mellea]